MAVAEGVYLYGVARAGTRAAGERGVVDAPVETLDHGALTALVSRVPAGTVRAKRRDLLRHSDVLQAAFGRGPVLPVRFGTVFRSGDELETELLAPRHDELVALLSRFDGTGELRVRASYHDGDALLADVVRGDPAIVRLREETRGLPGGHPRLVRLGEAVAGRVAERRRADADRLVSRLSEHAVDVRVDAPAGELEVVRASFLVPRRDLPRFESVLESVALAERHLLDLVCTGPVPPHSFVDLAPRDAAAAWAS